jgi:hypothetical protein
MFPIRHFINIYSYNYSKEDEVVPVHALKSYKASGDFCSFLTSALDRLWVVKPPGNNPGTNWIGGWVDPTAGTDGFWKKNLLSVPGFEARIVQTRTLRHYTDYTAKNKYKSIFIGVCKFRIPRPFRQFQDRKLRKTGLRVKQGVPRRTQNTEISGSRGRVEHFWVAFGKYLGQISTKTPPTLNKYFRCFSESLQTNADIILWNRTRPLPNTSIPVHHSLTTLLSGTT